VRQKNTGRSAGTSNRAEPSGSTGTVPRIRASVNEPCSVNGSMPPEKLTGLGQLFQHQQFSDLARPHAVHVSAEGDVEEDHLAGVL